MIAGVTDFSLGQLAVVGLLAVGLVLLGRLGWIVIDLTVDAMHRHDEPEPELLDEYADHARLADDIALPGDREHSWPNMAPLLNDDPFPAPAEPAGYPDLDEDTVTDNAPAGHHAPAPGRVSVDQVTGYARLAAVVSAPVDDTQAMAAVAAVSGEDGAR
jgi:hypothetical protein